MMGKIYLNRKKIDVKNNLNPTKMGYKFKSNEKNGAQKDSAGEE